MYTSASPYSFAVFLISVKMIFATGLHSCKNKFWILIQHFYFYIFLTYSEHIRKCSKLQILIIFPVLIPVQNFIFPGTGRENQKCRGKGRDGKFEACIPGSHGKREFPLTPDWKCHFWVPKYGHFCQKCPKLGDEKWHFRCPTENSETTFISPTSPKNDGFHIKS